MRSTPWPPSAACSEPCPTLAERSLHEPGHRPILAGWEFEPDEFRSASSPVTTAREKIQMRIDLGLIQMEVDGRPDGERPEGYESLLDSYEAAGAAGSRARQATLHARPRRRAPALMREGLQYYHRYLSAFHLERYDLVRAGHRAQPPALRLRGQACRPPARQDRVRPISPLRRDDAAPRPGASRHWPESDYTAALEQIDDGIRPSAGSSRLSAGRTTRTNAPSCSFLLRWRARSSASGRSARSNSWSSSSSSP